jgi:hypothetical protein
METSLQRNNLPSIADSASQLQQVRGRIYISIDGSRGDGFPSYVANVFTITDGFSLIGNNGGHLIHLTEYCMKSKRLTSQELWQVNCPSLPQRQGSGQTDT